ncbi:tetratricopeptide repeat protein [Eikenella sp. S3360]|uniref:Tetratricopeptide repeat protein n=1 Tax=Eikenella glucosivorans TaxID=2766967 RepID=A0ABS0N7R0_9NEIS|nr:tetratricopeptide repeat protein [Eikenella glucosivorans]MBH5328325.1 tetratricopeptide repeat protein [Eikenella glucosivorans]
MLPRHPLRALALAAALLLPLAAQAAPPAHRPQSEPLSHREIINRANYLVSALSSEIALQQGNGTDALATYMSLFRRTRDPVVAERAVEIALSGSTQLAEQALTAWRIAEPNPSPEQKRMRWIVAAAKGDVAAVHAGLPEVLAQTDRHRMRSVFLRVSQLALYHPEAADAPTTRLVHQAAARFPNLPEAAIADAIYAAHAGRTADANAALRRLASLDSDIRPLTSITLRLIAQRQPEVLQYFFSHADSRHLSPMWQTLQVESLISAKREEEAYRLLQSLLAKNPDPDLYIQAGILSVRRKEPVAVTLNYFDKAYLHGTQQQKSRAALLAAARLAEEKNTADAHAWLERVTTPESQFDKQLMLARLAEIDKNWPAAQDALLRAEAVVGRENTLFDADDLLIAQLRLTREQPPAEALNTLRTLHRRYSDNSAPPQMLALILEQRAILYADRLQQPDKAVADLKQAHELVPKNPDILNSLGYTMISQPGADLNQARRYIEQALARKPKAPEIQDSMGWVLFKQGRPQEALPYLQNAHREQPEADIAAHLGEVLWTLGRKDEAIAVWQAARSQDDSRQVLQETLQRLNITLPPLPEKNSSGANSNNGSSQ